MRPVSHRNRSQATVAAKAIKREEEQRVLRFRRMLAISVMSALTLSAVFLARAETWVTVNADGSVSKTEAQTRTQAAQYPPETSEETRARNAETLRAYDAYPQGTYGTYNGVQNPVSPGVILGQGAQTPNTTFFAGTFYPVPSYAYTYPTPGYTYPVGPVIPNVTPPMITTLPSTGTYYGYGYPGYPQYPTHPPYGYYPQPVYNYPAYGGTGVYYSGPAGGGGTITSSSTTSNNGYGVRLGNGGVRVNIGNGTTTTNSSTTVTTYGAR